MEDTASPAQPPLVASDQNATPLRAEGDHSYTTKQQQKVASGPDGIDQYELAKTQVTKVAKSAIPENVQLRKEVILGLIKSSSVFISYLSAAALDKMHEAGNKTLNAQHVLSAFKEMGFPEEYASQLRKEYNEKLRGDAEKTKEKPSGDGATNDSMDVDAAEESLPVGEETLAADDPPPALDESVVEDAIEDLPVAAAQEDGTVQHSGQDSAPQPEER